jgi:hypothetical protein
LRRAEAALDGVQASEPDPVEPDALGKRGQPGSI